MAVLDTGSDENSASYGRGSMAVSSASSPESQRSRTVWRSAVYRRTIWLLVVLAAIVLVVRGSAIVGWLRKVRVVSGSMASEFYGPHYQLNCPQCAGHFRVGVTYAPPEALCTCPNCGCRAVEWEDVQPQAGRRAWIDRWPLWTGDLETWDVVAYETDPSTSTRAVKRVVACGSGQVQIQRGDVLLAGHVQRKSLVQLQAMHLLVYDDQFRPEPSLGLPARWREADAGDDEDVCWTVTEKGFRCAAAEASGVSVAWLEYLQWACWQRPWPPQNGRADNLSSITMATTRTSPAQALNRVSDLELQCRLTTHGAGRVLMRIDDGLDCLELQITRPADVLEVTHNDETLAAPVQLKTLPQEGRYWRVTFVRCDRQAIVQINGAVVFVEPFLPKSGPRRDNVYPLAIGAAALDVEVDQLRVFRDIHYVGPRGESQWTAPTALGQGSFFCLETMCPCPPTVVRLVPSNRNR